MINTVLFDMDGVIVDSEPINLRIIGDIYDEIGVDVPEDVHLSSLGVNSIEWWTFILNTYGNNNNYTPEELYDKERTRILKYMMNPETDKGYFENLAIVLRKLKEKGFKTAIASASHYDIINSILKQGNLEDYFDTVVSAIDPNVKRGKPEPDIFLYAANKLNALPEECIVIEDSERGLEAAKKANMKTAAFLSAPKPIKLDDADYIFDHYDQFFENIKIFKEERGKK